MRPIDGNTYICGLIGNPVAHTKSPSIHNFLAEKTGFNLAYGAFPVDTGRLEKAIPGAFALGIKGLNVTVPYKEEVIPFLSDIDPLAKKIGAVNTLVRCENGYKGFNTDMPGLLRALGRDGVDVNGEDVIILSRLCRKNDKSILDAIVFFIEKHELYDDTGKKAKNFITYDRGKWYWYKGTRNVPIDESSKWQPIAKYRWIYDDDKEIEEISIIEQADAKVDENGNVKNYPILEKDGKHKYLFMRRINKFENDGLICTIYDQAFSTNEMSFSPQGVRSKIWFWGVIVLCLVI